MNHVGQQITRLRKSKGMSQSDLARILKVSPQAVQKWESGGGPKPDRLASIAAALKCKVEDLLITSPLRTLRLVTADSEPPQTSVHTQAMSTGIGMSPIPAWTVEGTLPPGEYVQIPRMDIAAPEDNEEIQVKINLNKQHAQTFPADRLRAKNVTANALAWMTAPDQSMSPRICQGDQLVIDTSQTSVVDGGVYGVFYDGGARIKRLFRRPGGGLVLRSDNSDQHPDMIISPDESTHIVIVGRVVLLTGDGGL